MQRSLFDVPDDVAFLNCANLSPQLRRVSAAGVEAVRSKEAPRRTRAPDWFELPERLRAAAARLVGADADGVALVPAVSSARLRVGRLRVGRRRGAFSS